jgi:hypothetical protein
MRNSPITNSLSILCLLLSSNRYCKTEFVGLPF